MGVFLNFQPTLTGSGRQSNEPKFCLKPLLEITWSLASIELLIDLLACLEPNLWPKIPILPQNQNIAIACIQSPTGAISIFYNSSLEHASELFEPSKDSWSLVVQWSATTGPRPGAGPWGVCCRAVSFSRLNALKHFCNLRSNYFRTFYERERIIVQLLSHLGIATMA